MSIFSLLPPSEARPACISTVIASATWRSLAAGVPHFSSSSLRMASAFAHFPELLICRLTTRTAAAHTAAVHTTAAATATLPISPTTPQPTKTHNTRSPNKQILNGFKCFRTKIESLVEFLGGYRYF